MLFLDVKPKVSHKWFRKTICSVDIIYKNAYRKDDNGYYQISLYGMHEVEEKKNNFLSGLT